MSSGWDETRQREHDFSNAVQQLVLAYELGDRMLVDFFVDDLKRRYSEALRK